MGTRWNASRVQGFIARNSAYEFQPEVIAFPGVGASESGGGGMSVHRVGGAARSAKSIEGAGAVS
jgi:hypothetical protein